MELDFEKKFTNTLETIYESIYVNKTLIVGREKHILQNLLEKNEYQFCTDIKHFKDKRIYLVDETTLQHDINNDKLDLDEINVILCDVFNIDLMKHFVEKGDIKIMVIWK